MVPNLLRESAIDRGPNRLFRERAELLDRADDLQIEMLAQTGIDDDDRPFAAILEAAEIAGDLVERALRRGQADAREPARVERLQAFEQERQEDAALVRAQSVDLVNDAMGDA